jgi:hypothetical protein
MLGPRYGTIQIGPMAQLHQGAPYNYVQMGGQGLV